MHAELDVFLPKNLVYPSVPVQKIEEPVVPQEVVTAPLQI